ncbi:hypothetical protein VD17_27865 [Pseudomonas fluorescens]|uniref:Transmembrane protein n=1 Tax=Pseudomonas fluorescens TaxID=294 RepID=A0A0F4UZR8_PSEFL|nr:hypothetical protein VD17_27865 [Pseudomonas fluorescens]
MIVGMLMLMLVVVVVVVVVTMFFMMSRFSSLNRPMLMVRSATLFFLLYVKTEDRLELVFLVHGVSTAEDNSTIQQPVPTTGSSTE